MNCLPPPAVFHFDQAAGRRPGERRCGAPGRYLTRDAVTDCFRAIPVKFDADKIELLAASAAAGIGLTTAVRQFCRWGLADIAAGDRRLTMIATRGSWTSIKFDMSMFAAIDGAAAAAGIRANGDAVRQLCQWGIQDLAGNAEKSP